MNPITTLIEIVGEDGPALKRVRQAIDWLTEKPEIHQLLEDAYALHKKPLVVEVDAEAGFPGLYNSNYHEIVVSPDECLAMKLPAKDGSIVHYSPERILAHEILHSTQPWDLKLAQEVKDVLDESTDRTLNSIPYERYQTRLSSAQTSAQLERVYADIFDNEVQPSLAAIHSELRAHPAIKEFCERFEDPAMRFENAFMKQHRGEPERVEDYFSSMLTNEREGFIQSKLEDERALHASGKSANAVAFP